MTISAYVGAACKGGGKVSAIWVSRKTAERRGYKIRCKCKECVWGFLVKAPLTGILQWYSNKQFTEVEA